MEEEEEEEGRNIVGRDTGSQICKGNDSTVKVASPATAKRVILVLILHVHTFMLLSGKLGKLNKNTNIG